MPLMKNNFDPKEVEKFDAIGEQWWQPDGPFKPLHELNPFRISFVLQHSELKEKKLLDIGCGGGIFAEALSVAGAHVNGIDLSPQAIETASQHAAENNLKIEYQHTCAEDYAKQHTNQFDIVTCMELLEHVPNPASIIQACADAAKPGADIFMSTLNRNPKAYLFAIVGAEYLLKLLPKGTHDFAKFIRPSELDTWAQAAGLELQHLAGLQYNPLTQKYKLNEDVSVNYLAHFRKKNA